MKRVNRYQHGATVLGATIGDDTPWWVFLDPTGMSTYAEIYKRATKKGDAGFYRGSAAQNPYWAQQRAAGAQNPFTTATTQRLQTGQQLQTTLRAQQAANIAALQRQLAAMPPVAPPASPSYAPPPTPSMPSGYPSAPASDGTPDGGAPSSEDDLERGATIVGDAIDPQYVVIKVKNMGDVVTKQGGAMGNVAYSLTPQTISNIAYERMRDDFKKGLAEKGVDADVTITAMPPTGKPPAGELWFGVAVGASTVGMGWLLWKLIAGGR